jgi:hypothetical protein
MEGQCQSKPDQISMRISLLTGWMIHLPVEFVHFSKEKDETTEPLFQEG